MKRGGVRGVQLRAQGRSGGDQRGDVAGGQQVGRGPVILPRQQVSGRDLMSRVEAVQVAGEAADGAEAEPVIIGRGAGREGRPRDGQAGRHVRGTEAVEIGGELPHLTAGGGQSEAE